MRGLYHGLFVIFDGGTVLADEGLVWIVDKDGEPFDRLLHEICFRYWPGGRRLILHCSGLPSVSVDHGLRLVSRGFAGQASPDVNPRRQRWLPSFWARPDV